MARLDNEWSESGLLETIFKEIAEIGDRIQIQIDATLSHAHQSSARETKRILCLRMHRVRTTTLIAQIVG
ncbi:hypothetical protein [Lacticaseibacillus jixiensis]|uniref:hypothetical protein n=1 Tax=Lacticaseibacillus jixiensis TaxID=3231926 RepID=UPI0036F4253B